MYICICNGITDTDIKSAVSDGALSYRAVRKTLGVGNQCGQCASEAKMIVAETLKTQQEHDYSGLFYPASA